MDEKKKKTKLKTINIVLDIFIYSVLSIFTLVLLFLFLRIFVFSGFRIPTDSMMPAIVPGDYVLVNKTAYGARLFNLSNALEGERVRIRRMPGYSRVRRNDVVVFHIPYPNTWQRMEMDMMQYFIKRCIGIPGDTIRIVNGIYVVNSDTEQYFGNIESQRMLSHTPAEMLPAGVYRAFPFDSLLNWTIKDFGPLYIPRKGDTIELDRTNILLYRRLIEWEKNRTLIVERDSLWDNGNHLAYHIFAHNYFFMGGDMVQNSQDSRYWGLVPEEFIVGRAVLIWSSRDRHSGEMRRDRVWRRIR